MKKLLCAAYATSLLMATTARAATVEERLEALESKQAELYHTLEQKKEGVPKISIGDKLTLSGLIEVNGYFASEKVRGGNHEGRSDLVVGTAQVGLEAKPTEFFTAKLALLDSSEEGLEVDEAYVEFEREIWLARVGRQYVPFGEFPSHFIEDPLTLALGETRATAVLAGLRNDLMQTSLFAFRGKADHLNTWGASAKITPAEGIEAGVSFLSDLTTSGAETWEELQQSRKRVAGAGAFAMVDFAPFQVCGEVLGALRDFDDGDLDADENGSGDRPLAWNMEAAWTILENLELAARLAGTREWAEAPKLQFGVDLSYGLGEGVVVSVEYLREEFDTDFSSLSMRDIVVTQLAAEF